MFRLSPDRAKILLALHGWSAVVLGLVLYVIVLTGTASVLAPEIADWSSPIEGGSVKEAKLPAGLDGALRELALEVDPTYYEEISAYAAAGGRVRVLFHRHEARPDSGKLEERGVEFDLDPRSFAVLERREGWIDEIAAQRSVSALALFLTSLHVRLHVPEPYGLILTGVLGLTMMLAAVTGLVIHRHFFRDLFTLRGTTGSALARRDLHSVAGSWILPFTLLLAFTGSFFSFADSFGLPVLAHVAFEGDEQRLDEALVGVALAEDARPAPLANIEQMIADAGRRSGSQPNFVEIERWGRADSQVTLYTQLKDGELVNPNYVYAGASGELRHVKPDFGLVPSAGGSLRELVTPLHFGNFAGWASKLLWVSLGLAAAYVSLTGLLLWCQRRREMPYWLAFARFTHWIGYGLPLALAATPYGYFTARFTGADVGDAMVVAFLGAGALAAGISWIVRELRALRRLMLALVGLTLAGLPLLRMICGGPEWPTAWEEARTVVVIDMLLVLGGALCVYAARWPRNADCVNVGRVEQASGSSSLQLAKQR